MPTWIAAVIAVAAITATYFSCIRPHLHGRGCAMGGSAGQNTGTPTAAAEAAETDRQLAELREELRVLRAQDHLDSCRLPGLDRTPPTDS